ncbi:PREDICTED: cell adhesion molecule-related/down-regulated by oncogenes, partial [Leptosomus discolor]|uniref:cell adhesion molecule-related/down-regulated by oncogenes n=1 Tax=Leptosomus discolor TaxID=188344 RepID=UPI00052296F2
MGQISYSCAFPSSRSSGAGCRFTPPESAAVVVVAGPSNVPHPPYLTPHFISEPLSTVQKPGGPVRLRCSAEPPTGRPSLCLGCSYPLADSLPGLADFETSVKAAVAAEEGGTAVIGCEVPESNPKAQVRFQVRGKWLEQSADNYLILPSGNLQILNVSLEDKGPYKCAAYNPVTHDLRTEPTGRKLVVTRSSSDGFHILHPLAPQSLAAPRHSSLMLECVVSGLPPASLRWVKDGRDALRKGRWKLLHSHLVTDRLEASDTGNYSCVVGNGSGVVKYVNYSLTVLEPASISKGLRDQSVAAGATAHLWCDARGSPAPALTWLHNAAPLPVSPRHLPAGNRLRIRAVAPEDSGLYQCVASNGVGIAQSTGRLRVLPGKGSKPVIVSPPASIAVVDGGDVTLSCSAAGVPLPVIRWYDSRGLVPSPSSQSKPQQPPGATPGSAVAEPTAFSLPQAASSSLRVRNVSRERAGEYTCEATNEHGSAVSKAFLTVVPSATGPRAEETAPVEVAQSDDGDFGAETGFSSSPPPKLRPAAAALEKASNGA